MKILITGGAGFIGSNAAQRYCRDGHEVFVIDNLSRPGSEHNLRWLQEQYPQLGFERVDIRDAEALEGALQSHEDLDLILHLAAQVAVTTSVEDPRLDFDINALGTLNLLESIRRHHPEAIVLYTSTNKVYGALDHLKVEEADTRYQLPGLPGGVPETMNLDFYSPYGCSKGTADQYMRDYARMYGLKTIVFRNSCIYGPRQFGIEDQGWLAWFMIAAGREDPITIYGDGKQVRDVLHVEDLLEAITAAYTKIEKTRGEIYNIGGGPSSSISVWREFGPMLEDLSQRKIEVGVSEWRPGDQKVFISDISKARDDFEWQPEIPLEVGIASLYNWIHENSELFS